MQLGEALAREKSWRENPNMRPQPSTAKAVATVLANRVQELEHQLALAQRLAIGRKVLILRGNPGRGPETGPGFGRKVPAVIQEVPAGTWQVRCQLLEDDPDAVGSPSRAGESGLWAISQIVED